MRQSAQLKESLERKIVTGKFRQGERLEELEIANSFGVSRTPVRETLMMLETIDLNEHMHVDTKLFTEFTAGLNE